jgi:flagellar FliJ protein
MFRFRLETLLRLRMAERDQRRTDLAKALRAEAMLQGEERKLQAEQRTLTEQSRSLKAPGAANVEALLATHRYEGLLSVQAKQIAAQLAQVSAETERRRLVLVEADREVRVLEKLRERQADVHRTNEQRQEAKAFDELATLGHLRKAEVRP